MLRWLLALLLIPFADAVLLGAVIVYVDVIGFVEMVALVVLTGLVGLLLVRAEGRRTIRKIQRSVARGAVPTNELLDGALLIAAGAFLLTPGLVTDVLGFLFVIPITRIPIRLAIKRYVVVPYVDTKTNGFATGAVWTGGFPNDGTGAGAGSAGFDDTVDLGEGEYRVDLGETYPTDPEADRRGGGSDDTPDEGEDRDAVGR